jgi:hypothetical protein
MAYQIGIPPERFWRMTPRTFFCCVEGYNRRERNDRRKLAWSLVHQLAIWGCKTSVDKLLGEQPEHPEFATAQEFREYAAAQVKKQRAREAARQERLKAHGH